MAYAAAYRVITSTVYILLLLSGLSHQCGPGAGGRRRRPRGKQVPLVFKQSVPNVSENTLAASGPPEGRITRGSDKFNLLVKSMNPDIIFRQEERTEADRIMTQRCKDRLNTLAIAVMNQWPGGVRLRVTEAWDEEGTHSRDSLHYEGRAVDITTSDRDRAKYGMLAALAVEAGFDYVYYESRGHIHCSVKSESATTSYHGGCFTGSELVTLESGATVTMANLEVGDNVLTLDSEGRAIFTPVVLFFHKDSEMESTFLRLETDLGAVLELTPNHLLFTYRSSHSQGHNQESHGSLLSVFARDISIGDVVLLQSSVRDHKMQKAKIVSITSATKKGVYAPLTLEGTIVVNNVFSSCYAFIDSHSIAHAALLPMRLWHQIEQFLFPTNAVSLRAPARHRNSSEVDSVQKDYYTIDGMHWYAYGLKAVAEWILPNSWLLA